MEGQSEDRPWCPVCAKDGKNNALMTFHVNFEESMVMCPEPSCTYPIGVEPLDRVLSAPDGAAPLLSLRRAPPVSSETTERQTSDSLFKNSSRLSDVHTITSISSPAPSAPSIIPSSPSQDLTLNAKIADTTLSLENNLNLDESIPAINTEFLDELFGSLNKSDENQDDVTPVDLPASLEKVPAVDVKTTSAVTSSSTSVTNSLESTQACTSTQAITSPSPARGSLLFGDKSPQQAQSIQSEVKPGDNVAESANPSVQTVSQTLYPQWKNKDSFCWLDVSLNLLIHCEYILKLAASLSADNVITSLINTYKRALELTNDRKGKGIHLETSLGHVVVKTGGGQSPRKLQSLSALAAECHPLVAATVSPEPTDEIDVNTLLHDVRESLWQYLQPKMRIARGMHDSPVFALPLLLNHIEIKKEFMVSYTWQMVCCHCGHHHEDKVEKIMPTFPNVPSDFSMLAPCFIRSCFKCNAQKQRINMVFDRLPPVVFVHFVEGISVTSFEELDFQYRGSNYRVTGVVRYKLDHFVCWLRHHKADESGAKQVLFDGLNHFILTLRKSNSVLQWSCVEPEELWRKCDDLEGGNTVFSTKNPEFPTKEVHVVMWEVIGECVHLKDEVTSVINDHSVPSTEDVASPVDNLTKKKTDEIAKVSRPIKKSVTVKQPPRSPVIDLTSKLESPDVQPQISRPTMPVPSVHKRLENSVPQKVSPVMQDNIIIPTPTGNLVPLKVRKSQPAVPKIKNQVPIKPMVSQTGVQPEKSVPTNKRKASDDRLQKIRERLEQLKAANAQRTAVKQGSIPPSYPTATHVSRSLLAQPINSVPSVPSAMASSQSQSGNTGKSYLAALQPFLQHKFESPMGTKSKNKQFSGYVTKAEKAMASEAEKAVASEAKKREDEKIALLLAAPAKKPGSKRTAARKTAVSNVTRSPKKSVRFTGDPVESQAGTKRRLDEALSSPTKFLKQDHDTADRSEMSTLTVNRPTDKKKSFREKLANAKIKQNAIITKVGMDPGGDGLTQNKDASSGKVRSEVSTGLQASINTKNDPAKVSTFAQEDSVIDELLQTVFGDADPSNVDFKTDTKSLDTPLSVPELTENSGLQSLEDDDIFSMPAFF